DAVTVLHGLSGPFGGLLPCFGSLRGSPGHTKSPLAMLLLEHPQIARLVLDAALLQQLHRRVAAPRARQSPVGVLTLEHRLVTTGAELAVVGGVPRPLVVCWLHGRVIALPVLAVRHCERLLPHH